MPAAPTFRVTRVVLPLILLGTCVALASGPARDLTSRQAARGTTARRPLSPADITDVAQLEMLEDTRHFDADVLGRILKSTHPEVRRRAALSIGRIVDPGGRALLVAAHGDADVEVAATVVFATGQLKDPSAVPWLAGLLSSPSTPATVATEAACALGKIRSPEARTALARYLTAAPATAAAVPVVSEALFAIGRFATREDLAPIVRWTTSANDDVRWHAAWALFRPRDPAAVPYLLKLADDKSADVRFWAVRGLAPPPAPPAPRGTAAGRSADELQPVRVGGAAQPPPVAPTILSAKLRASLTDPDRRVRTEAIRALVMYDDDASFTAVIAALDSPDAWISVSAAESLGRFASRKDVVVPKLVAAADAKRPTSLRVTALGPLVTLAPDAAIDVAAALVKDPSVVARTSAVQALQRLGTPGRAKLDALIAADPAVAALIPAPRTGPAPRPAQSVRSEADYRAIVERWIVPDYEGMEPKPHVTWETPRGTIELELNAGDAPLAMEYFMHVMTTGEIVGTEFGRVVPNFVAQQRAIASDAPLRDEVNRRGLMRGTLSWASSGLDTGRPGYTLGSTPQPHNEGDFTAFGRVIAGMDVVDHLELGDRIIAVHVLQK